MDIYIVTGASKGIGFELATQLQAKGKKVVGLARTETKEIEHFITADFTQPVQLENVLNQIIDGEKGEVSSWTLVNNAGTVEPIGLVGDVSAEETSRALAVNLTAPMILANAFIEKLANFEGAKRILNISSGAGRNPYAGWGVYCTTKAGLDHFSRVVAVEQKDAKNPVDVVSIAPGIIDTGMQEVIRSSEQEAFPLLDQFINYKEQGLLSSPRETAEGLIKLMEKENFKDFGPIADLREI